jgi:radical SAM protein with 4Fe4S-binding SPASM domain
MCGAVKGDGIAVDVDGIVYNCVAFSQSFQRYNVLKIENTKAVTCLGDLRSSSFPEQLATFPERVKKLEIFTEKEKKYSSYSNCAECPWSSGCMVCPASILHVPGSSDSHRVSDFQCAYYRTLGKHRDRFLQKVHPSNILEELDSISDFLRRVREGVSDKLQ